tara:strand:- start:2387 stop:2695 length:309 start_codon:yes stop_codon:yes gene_type:complete
MKEVFIGKFILSVAMVTFIVSCSQQSNSTPDTCNQSELKQQVVNKAEDLVEETLNPIVLGDENSNENFEPPALSLEPPTKIPLSFHTQSIQLKDTTFDLTLP